MRVPIEWLKDFVKVPEKIEDLTNGLTMAGHMLDKIDSVNSNKVIDLELRGNRADCYSIYGIAREVSALFKTPIKPPSLYKNLNKTKESENLKIDVKTEYLKRVMAVEISDINLTESPDWLKKRLQEYGIPSLNNIVDLSNYVMIETGQPLHVFDSEKIGSKLTIRLAKKGEEITTFLDEKVSLSENDLVWANDQAILSIAGAVGGKHHSVTENTKNILLEGASYNQANIRRTIHKHNLLTDAGIRHEKELDPNIVEFGVFRFLEIIKENKWGKISNEVLDFYPEPVKPHNLELNFNYLNKLSGTEIDRKNVTEIFKWLNFKLIRQNSDKLVVGCPTYRTDVNSEEDLVEEVLRIYGYDKIPERILSLEIPKDITPEYIDQEEIIKNKMIGLGFDEAINIPFIPANLQSENVSLSDKASPVVVINRPSPDVEEMQMTIYPNLVNYVKKIINERGEEARVFEVGKIYYQKNDEYTEKRVLGICYWKKGETNFRKYKGYLKAFFSLLQIDDIKFHPTSFLQIKDSYQMEIKGNIIGVGGRKDNILFTEIYLDSILGLSKKYIAELWPKYPPQIEDITFTLPEKTRVGDLISLIKSVDNSVHEIKLRDIYKNAYTFRLDYLNKNKTLTNEDVDNIRNKILSKVKQKFGAIQKI